MFLILISSLRVFRGVKRDARGFLGWLLGWVTWVRGFLVFRGCGHMATVGVDRNLSCGHTATRPYGPVFKTLK